MKMKTSWTRPPGPLDVWKVVDGYEILEDGTKNPVKFSIQDVPIDDERRQEVLNLFYKHYIVDEPCSKSLKLKDTDPDAVEDFQKLWDYSLDQQITIGCYKLDSDGAIKELVGANAIFFNTPETSKDILSIEQTFKSPKYKKIWAVCEYLVSKADVRKIYNVDSYIASIGLSVKPAFQGQKLGYHLLDARSSVGKKYRIPATSTSFSAEASQIQARRAGFEERASINFADILDDEGNPEFPNIDTKCIKLMTKKFF